MRKDTPLNEHGCQGKMTNLQPVPVNGCLTCRAREAVFPLYLMLVRLHLECCIQFRAPYSAPDIDKLEAIKRTSSEVIKDIENKTQEEKLREVDMLNLEKRRQGGDIITFHNCIKGHHQGSGERLFLLAKRDKT